MSRIRSAGRNPVVLSAVVSGLIAVLLLAAYALKPRDYLTGANGVRALSLIGSVPKGDTLCAYNVELPADTARIQFAMGPEGEAPAFARVRILDGTREVRSSRVDVPAYTTVTAGFQPLERSIDRATVCIRAEGEQLAVAGASGKQSNDRPLTLDGKRLDARVSMRFLPVEGAQRSIVSQWATIMHRASLFRPGLIVPAVLWLVMLVLLPAALVAAVVGVVTGVQGRKAVALVGLVAFVSSASWALITLPFDSPDEAEHFAYVQSVAERHTRPDSSPTQRGVYATAETLALEAVRHSTRIGGPEQRPPWTEAARDRYERREAEGLPTDDGGGFADATRLHLPAYYSLLAPAYWLGGDHVLDELTWARLFSGLFGVIVALCAFGIVREVAPSRADLALLAGLFVGLQPMFSFIAGAVNNDMGVNAGAALVAYLGIRLLRRPSVWVAVGFGAALAVTPIMKGTGLALIPPALIVIAGFVWRRPGWRAGAAALAGTAAAFLVVGAAIRRALSAAIADGAPGTVTGEGAVGASILSPLGGKVSYTWQVLFPRLPFMQEHFVMNWPFWDIYIVRGWGSFGWYSFNLPRAALMAVVGVGAAIACVGVVALWRQRADVARWVWEVLFLVAIPITVFVAISFAYYTAAPRDVPGEQGRYLFTAAAPLAALAALSLLGLPKAWQRPVGVTLLVGLAALTYLGRLTYLTGVFT